jgi:hypothetical protein
MWEKKSLQFQIWAFILVTRSYLMLSNIHFKHKLCFSMTGFLYQHKGYADSICLIYRNRSHVFTNVSFHWMAEQRVAMKFNWTSGKRNMLVFALTARWLWKLFRLPKLHLHWYDSTKRHWMISLPGTLWDCIGSMDMLGYEEMKLPTSSQETVLFKSLLDLSHLSGYLR